MTIEDAYQISQHFYTPYRGKVLYTLNYTYSH